MRLETGCVEERWGRSMVRRKVQGGGSSEGYRRPMGYRVRGAPGSLRVRVRVRVRREL